MSEEGDKFNSKNTVSCWYCFSYAQNCIKSVSRRRNKEDFFTSFNNSVTIVNNYFKKMSNPKFVEKEKLVAEQLNGRFAMLGFIAAIGAYLTTGQIIPGFV